MNRIRAVLLVDHPIQHFSPALRALATHPQLRVRTFYWKAPANGVHDPAFGRHIRWNTDLYTGYDSWSPRDEAAAWIRGLSVLRELYRDRPEVMLCFGWASPVARVGIAFASVTGTPLLYYGDSNWQASVNGRYDRVRKRILRRLFQSADGAISTGAFNREFYIAHGLDPRRIHPGVCPANVEAFYAAGLERPERDSSEKDDRPLVIGFAGKFIAAKGVGDLIDAVATLPRERPWELWLIGDGPLRPDLQVAVARRGLRDRVRFLGFKNTDELPLLMSAVDIMVMPSRREPRGLVAVEAMAAGAATIVSSATSVWGPGDVLQHEHSGLVFARGDVGALAKCLRQLMDDPAMRRRLGAAGRSRALSCGPDQFAATTAAALISTVERQTLVPSR
jgi:glycosyltransferase involved in cell wall biosynthesis